MFFLELDLRLVAYHKLKNERFDKQVLKYSHTSQPINQKKSQLFAYDDR